MIKIFFILTSCAFLFLGCSQEKNEVPKQEIKEIVQSPVVIAPKTSIPQYTRKQVLVARKKYSIEVLRFDKELTGSEYKKTNLVRIKITNNSDITLPLLTLKTSRWNNDKVIT